MSARFQKRIESSIERITESGCWIWMGAINGRGYGSLCFDAKRWKAHRFSWAAYFGEIPQEMHVLHRCDIPSCVNPYHLFLGNHFDNMQDKERKCRGNHAIGAKNARHTHPETTCCGDHHWMRRYRERTLGSSNNRAVLTEQDVTEIRSSRFPSSQLALRFGISRTHANRIRRGQAWSHL